MQALSAKVNALITSLQGHIHLFYIIFLEFGICFWGGASNFQIAKSLLSLWYVEKKWLELHFWKGLILCNSSWEYGGGGENLNGKTCGFHSAVEVKAGDVKPGCAVPDKMLSKKEKSYEPTAAGKGHFRLQYSA